MAGSVGSSCNTIDLLSDSVMINNNDNKSFSNNCRTCSLVVRQNLPTRSTDLIGLNIDEKSLRNKLHLCCPEMDLCLITNQSLCLNCFEIVNIINRFIRKCYTGKGNLNRNFFDSYHTQNFHSFESYSFVVKNEIKSEEIDLSEMGSSANTRSTTITNKNLRIVQKYNPKIDGDCDYNSKQSTVFTVFHTEKIFCESVEIDKEHLSEINLNQNTPIQIVKKPPKHLHNNFKKASAINQRQIAFHNNSNKPFNCSQGDRSVNKEIKEKSHQLHLNTGRKRFKCSKCNFSSTSKSSLQSHICILIERFNCSYCVYSSIRKSSLIQHIRSHARNKLFKCSHCNYSAGWKSSLKNHIRTHTGERPFKCLHCNYSSAQKTSLTMHMHTHTGKKPFKCSQCNFCTTRKTHLTGHIRTHTGEKPFKCAHCDYICALKNNLKSHVLTHMGVKPFKCSQCDYSTIQKNYLTTHIRIHMKKKPFKCFHCRYSTYQKGNLTVHMRTHTGEKPFKCSHCNFSTNQKSYLTIHTRTHTGEKPFKCSYCNYASTRNTHLKNHINTHLGE